jgi:hypothetical protein
MAIHFADDMEKGLLENANCGGENVHRGAMLGALWGTHNGADVAGMELVGQLKDRAELSDEIEAFVKAVTSRNTALEQAASPAVGDTGASL